MLARIFVPALVLASLFSGRADAATILITDGFTNTTSPSAFSYGYYANYSSTSSGLNPSPTLGFTPFASTSGVRDSHGNLYPDLVLKNTMSGNIDPNVIYNSSNTDVNTGSDYGNITFHAQALTFGPYLGPTVARFTASAAGTYDVSALFTTVQQVNTIPNDYVIINGGTATPLTHSTFDLHNGQGPQGTASYNMNLSLKRGDTVDFVVFGNNTNNKSTQVDASFTAVPEPATLAMCGTAGLIAAAVASHRRRKSRGSVA